MVTVNFAQEYSIDENGYPKDLPSLDVFVCAPYIMPILEQMGIKVRYQEDDNLDQEHRWAIEFFLLLNSHFKEFHSHLIHDEEEIISLALDECEFLFKGFMSCVQEVEGCSFNLAEYQARMWVESTKSIVWSALRNNTLSSDVKKKKRGTTRLFKSIYCKLDELFDSFYESNIENPYIGLDNCIMFNIWGVGYQSQRDSIRAKEILSSVDQEKVDISKNKTAFYNEVERRIMEAVEEKQEQAFYNKVDSLCKDIEGMFIDYMRHYHKQKILDENVIKSICRHWKEESITIVQRAYAVLSAEYAVDIKRGRYNRIFPCDDGEELYAHDKRAMIAQKVNDTISAICDKYIKRGNSQPWNTKLNALEIHFDKLYLLMKDKYFSGISRDDFEYAIRNADFHEIITSAKSKGSRTGISGCIYFFISELGDNLGKEWLYKAAESCTQKKATEAVTNIRSHSDTESQKEFSRLLKQNITNYKPRVRRNRKKQ